MLMQQAVLPRRQAADIVEATLLETDPHHAGNKDALRHLLASHPGQPETALSQYLLTIRGQTLSLGALRTGCRKRPDTTGGPR